MIQERIKSTGSNTTSKKFLETNPDFDVSLIDASLGKESFFRLQKVENSYEPKINLYEGRGERKTILGRNSIFSAFKFPMEVDRKRDFISADLSLSFAYTYVVIVSFLIFGLLPIFILNHFFQIPDDFNSAILIGIFLLINIMLTTTKHPFGHAPRG